MLQLYEYHAMSSAYAEISIFEATLIDAFKAARTTAGRQAMRPPYLNAEMAEIA